MFQKHRKRRIAIFAAFALMASSLSAGLLSCTGLLKTEAEEVAPVVKYEFKDAENVLKDSMGNYDMEFRNAWVEGGTGPLLDKYTLLDGGGISFDGELCMALDLENDVLDTLSAMTLCFEVKLPEDLEQITGSWAPLISLGNGSKQFDVSTVSGSDFLPLAVYGTDMKHYWNELDLKGGIDTAKEFHEYIISIRPGGQLHLYIDGKEYITNKTPCDIAADWNMNDSTHSLAFGGHYNGAATYPSEGAIKNVTIYDFAMGASAVKAYTENGIVTDADLDKTIEDIEVVFEGGVSDVKLTNAMKNEDIFKALKSAKAKISLDDGNKEEIPVTWTEVKNQGNRYKAVGTIAPDEAYINPFGTTVEYYLDVARADREGTEINPVVKYEFLTDKYLLQDKMGNYNLSFRNAYKEGGNGPLMNQYELLEWGGVKLSKGFTATMDQNNDLGDKLKSFTLTFDYKLEAAADKWGLVAGWGSFNPGKYIFLYVGNNDTNLRLTVNGIHEDQENKGTIIGDVSGEDLHKVTLSVDLDAKKVYCWLDGEQKAELTLPDGWTMKEDAHSFTIGGGYNGLSVYPCPGIIKDVAIYDFAMNDAVAKIYAKQGDVYTSDISTLASVEKIEVVFEGEPTSKALNSIMTTEQMFEALNPASVKATLTNDRTANAAITWEEVYVENDKYYAKGQLSEQLGYANSFGTTVTYELSVADITEVGAPVFKDGKVSTEELKDSMTYDEMLTKINPATVEVTFGDGTKETVNVSWTIIRAKMGVYTLIGSAVYEDTEIATVEFVLTVTETNEGVARELTPLALWEFDDPDNIGKDTMGNYQLQAAAKEGGNTSDPRGMGEIIDGRLYMDGDDCLTLPSYNDIGDDLSRGFTLNFQVEQPGDISDRLVPGTWANPVSFGFNDWNAQVYCLFQVNTDNGGTEMEIDAHGITKNRVDGSYGTYWGPIVGDIAGGTMHNVTLSVMPGGLFQVYFDGALAYSEACPEGWSTEHSNMTFAIGGSCVWGNGYSFFKGYIDNVSVYSFAMTLEQSNAFWEKGKIVAGDMNGDIITSIDNTPDFAGQSVTNKNLTDKLTENQFLNRMNPATVNGVFENGKTVAIPVEWTRVEVENGQYYVIGEVSAVGLGYATFLTESVEIKQAVEVEKADRTITIEEAEGGTVTADKTAAKLGEKVTLTITPDKGYKLAKVYVNDVELTADANGGYSFVVEGNENIEIYAEFEKSESDGCGSTASVASVFALLTIGGAAFIGKRKNGRR